MFEAEMPSHHHGRAEEPGGMLSAATLGWACLVGSALTFSDQMVRILNLEFQEISFHRYATVDEVLSDNRDPHLIVLDYAASDHPIDLVASLRARAPGASTALAYRSLEHAPELCDGSRMQAISPPVSLVPINVSLDVWLSVIRLLLCGGDFVAREIINAWHMNGGPRPVPGAPPPGRLPADPNVSLTRREMEVLPLIAEGKQNKQIADALSLSEHTVKLHTHNIFQKLKVSNRTCAADWYRSHGGERLSCVR